MPPPLDDFQYICDDAYTNRMFLDMEIKIMKALNFDINIPIAYRYLRRFSRVTQMGMEILTLSRFILELSLQGSKEIQIHCKVVKKYPLLVPWREGGSQGQKQKFSHFVTCCSPTHGLYKMGSLFSQLPTLNSATVGR